MQKDYHEIKLGDQTLIYPVALEDKVKAGILAMQEDLGVDVSWFRKSTNQPNNNWGAGDPEKDQTAIIKAGPVDKQEWWLEGTKQCIKANLDHPTRDSFNNIVEHIRTLVKQEDNSSYSQAIEDVRGRLPVELSTVIDKNPKHSKRDKEMIVLGAAWQVKETHELLNNLKNGDNSGDN